MKRIYIVTAVTADNGADISDIERDIKSFGCQAVSPYAIISRKGAFLKKVSDCIAQMLSCDAVYAADGCTNTKRCRIELNVARELGMKVFHSPNTLDTLKQYIIPYAE